MSLALVTGSSGLVGAAVADALAAAGWTVRGADLTPGARTQVAGDLREPAVRRRALAGVDVLVHAAALHAPHVGVVPDHEFRAVNVTLTRDLLAQAERGGTSRVVYVSSTSVYGHALVPAGRAVWVDETLTPRPRDVYDETKLAAERLVAAGRIPAVTLRISRCFPEPLPDLVLHRLHRGVDVTDVAAATLLALAPGAPRGTYVISGPHPFTPADREPLWGDAARLITERAPEAAAFLTASGHRLPARLDRVYDSTRATAALGYHPSATAAHLIPPT